MKFKEWWDVTGCTTTISQIEHLVHIYMLSSYLATLSDKSNNSSTSHSHKTSELTQVQPASLNNLARPGEGDGVYFSRTYGPDGAKCKGSVE